MKTIREVDHLDDPKGTRHVRLKVMLMPSDPKKVAGLVRMNDPEPNHDVSIHLSGLPTEIERARALAWKIAKEQKAEVIWINDPKGLYPMHERAPQVIGQTA